MTTLPHRAGGPADAPAVVLLHGFPASSLLWRSLEPALVPAMRWVAPDLFRTAGADVEHEIALAHELPVHAANTPLPEGNRVVNRKRSSEAKRAVERHRVRTEML